MNIFGDLAATRNWACLRIAQKHAVAWTAAILAISCSGSLGAAENECAMTSGMQIYSNAWLSEETGDVNGYELAVQKSATDSVDVLLYVYEGAPNDQGIHIPGRLSGKKLTAKGIWEEKLIEHPSKKEIVERHFVRMQGTIDATRFVGRLTIEGLVTPAKAVRLKRVKHIWGCKAAAALSTK